MNITFKFEKEAVLYEIPYSDMTQPLKSGPCILDHECIKNIFGSMKKPPTSIRDTTFLLF